MRIAVGAHALDYEVRGPETGRSLLFIHGLTSDRRSLSLPLEPIFAAAPGAWRRVYLDLPGHGASTGDAAAASADDLVDTLVKLAREVCPTTPALVAHSYGGYLALGVARELARDLAGMFLITPVVEPDFHRRRLPAERVLARDAGLEFRDAQEESTFGGETVQQTRPVLERWREAMDAGHRLQDLAFVNAVRARYVLSRPGFAALAEVRAPVAVVCGRDDGWTGYEDALALVRAIEDTQLTILPGCGHLPHLEAPAAFAPRLLEWLARL